MIVLGLLGTIGFFFLLYQIQTRTRRATNRHLWSRQRYRRGMASIKTKTVIVSRLSPEQVIAAARRG